MILNANPAHKGALCAKMTHIASSVLHFILTATLPLAALNVFDVKIT
jgi:hypothetical protein